jgi:hypothetical protein
MGQRNSADVGIRRAAKGSLVGAKQFGNGTQLHVNFQTNNGFVGHKQKFNPQKKRFPLVVANFER